MKRFQARPFNVNDEEGSHTELEVTCPSCKRKFWVLRVWLRSHELRARPCPYCFRTGQLPKKRRQV